MTDRITISNFNCTENLPRYREREPYTFEYCELNAETSKTNMRYTGEKSDHGKYNPFVKKGDIILIKGRSGKYKVIEVNEDKLSVIPETAKDLSKIIACRWSDFAGWRSG